MEASFAKTKDEKKSAEEITDLLMADAPEGFLPKEVIALVCSSSIQVFLAWPKSKLMEAYHFAVKNGYSEKAFWLKSFIEKDLDGDHDPETPKPGSSLVRKKTLRLARPSRYKIRT